MAPAACSRELAARFAALPPTAWVVVLDGLCSDDQLRGLGHRYLRAVPNRPVPKDRPGLVGCLIPPRGTPHDQMAAFVAELMKWVPPAPAPATIAETLGALRAATSSGEYARTVWASLCGSDEAVAQTAVAHATDTVRRASTEPSQGMNAEALADLIVRRLEPKLRPPAGKDESNRLLDRVEQTRAELHGLRGRLDGGLGELVKLLREVASRPTGPTQETLLGEMTRLLAERVNTPPPWLGDVMRFLGETDRRIQTLASAACGVPSVRAQREAWRLAHPAAAPRVALVADLENLTVNAREWRGRRINFQALYERLGRGGDVVSAVAFAVQAPGQGAFLGALRHAGWNPRVRGSTMTASGRRKANWDVGLTLHVVGLASRVDIVGLATGDGDFADLLEWLREQGIETRAAAIPEAAAEKLRVAADEFVAVRDDMLIDAPQLNTPRGMASTDDNDGSRSVTRSLVGLNQ